MKPALTLEAFADWCEKQPAGKEYDYLDPSACAFAQYLGFLGIEVFAVGSTGWNKPGEPLFSRPLPIGVDDAVAMRPRLFGLLSRRLRTALSEAVQP